MASFRYQPLELGRPSFRLVRLFRDDGNRLCCELFQAFLDDRDSVLPYEALSYTWGSPDFANSIMVNGNELRVTSSLYSALVQLRSVAEDRILWIDAICIDQSNPVERGHQVQQMTYIYRQADRVIFWMGHATLETNIFMDALQSFQEESAKRACNHFKLADPRWREIWDMSQLLLQGRHSDLGLKRKEGLLDLLNRSWFTRVWILQEVANAQAAIICCGSRSAPARLFALTPLLLDIKPAGLCQAVLDIMPGPSRKETWWAESRELYVLLKHFGSSCATDPRDIIYALRGLSTDVDDPAVLAPDYEESTGNFLRRASEFLFYCDLNMHQPKINSITRLAQEVTTFNSAAIGHLISLSRKSELSLVLRRGGIIITEHIVETACTNTIDGTELLCYLFENGGDRIHLQEDAVLAIARLANVAAMKSLLAYRMDEVHVTEALLVCAASNIQDRGEMLLLLLDHGQIDVTEWVLVAAALNVFETDVMETILRSLSEKTIIDRAVRILCSPSTYTKNWTALIPSHRPLYRAYIVEAFVASIHRHGVQLDQDTMMAVDQAAGLATSRPADEHGEVIDANWTDGNDKEHTSLTNGARGTSIVRSVFGKDADVKNDYCSGRAPRAWVEILRHWQLSELVSTSNTSQRPTSRNGKAWPGALHVWIPLLVWHPALVWQPSLAWYGLFPRLSWKQWWTWQPALMWQNSKGSLLTFRPPLLFLIFNHILVSGASFFLHCVIQASASLLSSAYSDVHW